MKPTSKQIVILLLLGAIAVSCSKPAAPAPVKGPEAQSRTEFTGRVENYFEYEPLHSGRVSQVRIHLTDLSDGFPVQQAQVTLAMRARANSTEDLANSVIAVRNAAPILVKNIADVR